MEFHDQVIIDGNAVYEVDHNCRSQIQSTEFKGDKESMFQWMLLLFLMFLK